MLHLFATDPRPRGQAAFPRQRPDSDQDSRQLLGAGRLGGYRNFVLVTLCTGQRSPHSLNWDGASPMTENS